MEIKFNDFFGHLFWRCLPILLLLFLLHTKARLVAIFVCLAFQNLLLRFFSIFRIIVAHEAMIQPPTPAK